MGSSCRHGLSPLHWHELLLFVGLALGLADGLNVVPPCVPCVVGLNVVPPCVPCVVGLWVAPDPEPELDPDADL